MYGIMFAKQQNYFETEFLMELKMRAIMKEMVSVKEAQRILNVNSKNLNKMIKTGKLMSHKVGSKVQINRKSLISLLDCCDNIPSNSPLNFQPDLTSAEREMITDWT